MTLQAGTGLGWRPQFRAIRKPLLTALALLLPGLALAADGIFPDRRREQYRNDPGHVVVPFLFDLPGIGKGYGLLGAVTNIKGSYTDVSGSMFGGDVSGQALAVDSLHLIDKRLILDIGGVHLSRVMTRNYHQRGMDTDKNDYSLTEFGPMYFGGTRLTATFHERQAEAFVGWYGGQITFRSLRDRDGRVISQSSDSPTFHHEQVVFGGKLDLTDDYTDPHRGIRLEPSIWPAPRRDMGPSYYTTNLNASAYMPVGRRNTWAFNYFRSDAHVIRKGETDRAAVERSVGLTCATLTDPVEKSRCDKVIATLQAANAHGTATSLGGFMRLRAYAEGRFTGAHTEFLGTEFRWNLTDAVRPFDIYVMKDIRTAVQVALFYEVGSVADDSGDLWKTSRAAYGMGLRVVTQSGLVYRVDLGGGSEGIAPSIFFQYPWEL